MIDADDSLSRQWHKIRKELWDQGWVLPWKIHEIPMFLKTWHHVNDIFDQINLCKKAKRIFVIQINPPKYPGDFLLNDWDCDSLANFPIMQKQVSDHELISDKNRDWSFGHVLIIVYDTSGMSGDYVYSGVSVSAKDS